MSHTNDTAVRKLTGDNFEKEVLLSDKPVLVDFYAGWCGPCKAVAPIIEDFARKYSERIKVGKVNVDEETGLTKAFRIFSIPTLLLFRGGKVTETARGRQSMQQLEAMTE